MESDGQVSGGAGRYATEQSTVDARVQEYYAGRTGWDEHARLTVGSAQGRVEHVRTQELVRQRLAPGARVLDVGGATDGYEMFDPAAWQAVLEHGLAPAGIRFPAAHFHDAAELAAEATESGLSGVVVHGIEGPAGGALERVPLDAPEAPELIDAALTLARALSTTPGVTDMSQHVLAIGTVSA
ncbi:hypothetical protein [Promicromonospora iranensis]|uniref:Uncharacterized protein n=1 Tax=Promicromonospora iranensis TaxID=1105144 RepID=A0ABU2CGV6_9MICO|nr:hypothetical protein [Promicromonospora iranensis]MDR7380548.1 hypothetical protein [Promicromonospora iranensis]